MRQQRSWQTNHAAQKANRTALAGGNANKCKTAAWVCKGIDKCRPIGKASDVKLCTNPFKLMES